MPPTPEIERLRVSNFVAETSLYLTPLSASGMRATMISAL